MKAIVMILMMFMLVGCNKSDVSEIAPTETSIEESTEATEMETEIRIAHGRYYTNGTVITDDGHEWGYSTTEIYNRKPYDGMPIVVVFIKGTEIEKDIIKGVIYDMETAMYDALESEMETNEDWEVSRNGNEIRIDIAE